jgi:hypothetical protein
MLQHWLIVLFAWQNAQRSLVVLSYSNHLIVKSRVAMLFWAAMVWAIELGVNGLSKGYPITRLSGYLFFAPQ